MDFPSPGSPSLESLFRSHYPRLFYFAYKMTGDRQAAEDITQDAFLHYSGKQLDHPTEDSAAAYLYSTIRHACINRYRHREVEARYARSVLRDANETESPPGLDQIINAETLGQIHRAIEDLPPACRQVFRLAFLEGYKNPEIAAQLGLSVNTVKTHKARALELLRLKLDIASFILLQVLLHHC